MKNIDLYNLSIKNYKIASIKKLTKKNRAKKLVILTKLNGNNKVTKKLFTSTHININLILDFLKFLI